MIDFDTAGSSQIAGYTGIRPREVCWKATQWIDIHADLPLSGSFHLKLVTLEVELTDVMLINLYMACRIEAFTLKWSEKLTFTRSYLINYGYNFNLKFSWY